MKRFKFIFVLFLILAFVKTEVSFGQALKEVSSMLGNTNKNIQPIGVKITIPYSKYNKRLDFWKKYWESSGQKVDIEKYKSNITGSGVIINDLGYIVTNNHVIEGSKDSIMVILYDGSKYFADIVGTDPITDLAVLRIYEQNLKYVKFGNSDEMVPGNLVMALGNPLLLSKTVTLGIVSAIGKSDDEVFDKIVEKDNKFKIRNYIQTDAAINPGNSGGGLFNVESELIGINTEIMTISGYNIGYGFAIPSNTVKPICEELIKYGKVQRGYLGIDYISLDERNAKRLKFKYKNGVLITEIGKNSPADSASLKKDDIILEIDDIKIKNSSTLQLVLTEKKPENVIKFKVFRSLKDTTIAVKLGKNPEKEEPIEYFSKKASLNAVLTEEVLNGKTHLKFDNIYENGTLDKCNILTDDILISLDDISMNNYSDIEKYILNKKPGEIFKISVNRNGTIINSTGILNSYR